MGHWKWHNSCEPIEEIRVPSWMQPAPCSFLASASGYLWIADSNGPQIILPSVGSSINTTTWIINSLCRSFCSSSSVNATSPRRVLHVWCDQSNKSNARMHVTMIMLSWRGCRLTPTFLLNILKVWSYLLGCEVSESYPKTCITSMSIPELMAYLFVRVRLVADLFVRLRLVANLFVRVRLMAELRHINGYGLFSDKCHCGMKGVVSFS